MKVRVAYTVEVDAHLRRAIRAYYGETGLATRAEVAKFYELNGGTLDDDLPSQADIDALDEEPAKRDALDEEPAKRES